jgi:hypothetical protein
VKLILIENVVFDPPIFDAGDEMPELDAIVSLSLSVVRKDY